MARSLTSGIVALANSNSKVKYRFSASGLLVAGIVLIALSWTSIGDFASETAWTTDDTAVYARLVQENHSLEYSTASQAGLTEDEFQAKKQDTRHRLDRMIDKLEYAKSRSAAWSRMLFAAGVALSATGAFLHFLSRAKGSAT